MLTFISIVHVVVAIFLVIVVLIQDSKGGGVAGTFGGGSGNANTLMGATGAVSFMVKLTRGLVLVFAITSILLTRIATGEKGSALDLAGPTPTEQRQAEDAAKKPTEVKEADAAAAGATAGQPAASETKPADAKPADQGTTAPAQKK